MKHCRLTTYPIRLAGRNLPDLDDSGCLRLSFFSDLHNCCSEPERREFLRLLKKAKPDLVLCGGDSIVAKPGQSVLPAVSLLQHIGEDYPLVVGTGNHELRTRLYPETYPGMYETYRAALDESRCILLENRQTQILCKGVPLTICGFDIPAVYYSRWHNRPVPVTELQQVFGSPKPDAVTILLAHHPKMVQTGFAWGADLTLCGHYHGGVIRFSEHRGLISPDLRLFPGNACGHFQNGQKHAMITSGCGEHAIPLRIHNMREIVSITLGS